MEITVGAVNNRPLLTIDIKTTSSAQKLDKKQILGRFYDDLYTLPSFDPKACNHELYHWTVIYTLTSGKQRLSPTIQSGKTTKWRAKFLYPIIIRIFSATEWTSSNRSQLYLIENSDIIPQSSTASIFCHVQGAQFPCFDFCVEIKGREYHWLEMKKLKMIVSEPTQIERVCKYISPKQKERYSLCRFQGIGRYRYSWFVDKIR